MTFILVVIVGLGASLAMWLTGYSFLVPIPLALAGLTLGIVALTNPR